MPSGWGFPVELNDNDLWPFWHWHRFFFTDGWVKESGATSHFSRFLAVVFLTVQIGFGVTYLIGAHKRLKTVDKRLREARTKEQITRRNYDMATTDYSQLKEECSQDRQVTKEAEEALLRRREDVSAENYVDMDDASLRIEFLQNSPQKKAADAAIRSLEEEVANFRALKDKEEEAKMKLQLVRNDEVEKNERVNSAEAKVRFTLREHREALDKMEEVGTERNSAKFALMKLAILWLVVWYVYGVLYFSFDYYAEDNPSA